MALQLTLRVGDSSGQDISLVGSGVSTLYYPMHDPDIHQDLIANLGDGNSLSVPSWSNITESIDVLIQGTAAEVRDKIQAIQRLLDLARQGTTGYLDDKLYLLVQFDQDSEAWRSQILAAKLDYPALTDEVWRGKVQATIILTRRYYFETAAIKSVAITSGVTGTPTTDYATIINDDDTSYSNWIMIAADQIAGSIPAPAKLYLNNSSGGDRSLGTVYIGNYVWTSPASVDPIFRAEEAAGGSGSISTLETSMGYWSLSSGNLIGSFKGQFGRVIVVFSDRPATTTLLRAALEYRAPIPILDVALGELVLASGVDFVEDLGSIPLPPGGYYSNVGTNLYLSTRAKAASGTDTVGINWVQVFPSGAGRFRTLKGIYNMSVGSTDTIVDDGPADATYYLDGATALPLFRALHSPIYLWPGKQQSLRFLISGGTSMEAGQTWAAKVEYRARRLTV